MKKAKNNPPQQIPLYRLSQFEELIVAAITGLFILFLYTPIFWIWFSTFKNPCFFNKPLEKYWECWNKLIEIFGFTGTVGTILISPIIGLIFKPIGLWTDSKVLYPIFMTSNRFIKRVYNTSKKMYRLEIGNKEWEKLLTSEAPSFSRLGKSKYAEYRVWLYANQATGAYWSWEHFLHWFYLYLSHIFLRIPIYWLFLFIFSPIVIFSSKLCTEEKALVISVILIVSIIIFLLKNPWLFIFWLFLPMGLVFFQKLPWKQWMLLLLISVGAFFILYAQSICQLVIFKQTDKTLYERFKTEQGQSYKQQYKSKRES